MQPYYTFAHADDLRVLTAFKGLVPWNVKKSDRETCLCRQCELLHLQESAKVVENELLGAKTGVLLHEEELVRYGRRVGVPRQRSTYARVSCLRGGCLQYGFYRQLWSVSLRKILVDAGGHLLPNPSPQMAMKQSFD
eukprot:4753899-Pleurochrysis_carterae.AAC.6